MAATTACQPKATSVAAVSTPVPERAANTATEAPATTKAPLFQLTSLNGKANCNPADCIKICDPKNCDPSACEPANCKPGVKTASATNSTTTIAMKQE